MEQIEPVVGNGAVDKEGNVIPFGKVLGYTDLAGWIIRDFDGDINVPGISRCMSFYENGVCNVSGSTINEATIHEMQWYRIDQVSTRKVDDSGMASCKILLPSPRRSKCIIEMAKI